MERIKWIDQLKGFTIFLVVYAHNFPFIEKYIYTFHMPLFLMISGFFIPSSTDVLVLKKRFIGIMVPYFFWAILLFLFWFFIAKDIGDSAVKNLSTTKNFIGVFYAQGGREYMDWGIPMWFLPMIFSAFLFHFFICKVTSNQYIILILAFILMFIGFQIKGNLIWSFNVALVGVFFITAGNYFYKNLLTLSKKYMVMLLFALLFIHIVTLGYNEKIDMFRSTYGNHLIFILSGLSGSLFYILLFFLIPKFTIFSFFGKFTLLILALQLVALAVVKFILMYGFSWHDFNFTELQKFIIAIIQMLLIIPVFLIVNRFIPFANGGYKKI